MLDAALAAWHDDARFTSDALGWSIIAATGVHNGDTSVAFPDKQVADILRNLQLLKKSNSWVKTVGEVLTEIYHRPLDLGKLGSNFGIEFSNFWTRWYNGYLDGTPLDWELQKRVALISDDVWEAGVEAVAEAIGKIEAEFLLEQVPQAEKIEFDEEISKFSASPIPIEKADLLGATLSQVEDALEDVLAASSNGLHDGAREVRVLRRTITKYGNDPQRIEMDFATVSAGLSRQIASDELPASEENLALQSALDEGGRAIRATHPEVADNRSILNSQVVAELTNEHKSTLADAQPILEAISDHRLGEDFADDIPFLLLPSMRANVESDIVFATGYAEKARVISRATKMFLLLKKTPEFVHLIDGSAGYKAARIMTTLAALVALGIAIF